MTICLVEVWKIEVYDFPILKFLLILINLYFAYIYTYILECVIAAFEFILLIHGQWDIYLVFQMKNIRNFLGK